MFFYIRLIHKTDVNEFSTLDTWWSQKLLSKKFMSLG